MSIAVFQNLIIELDNVRDYGPLVIDINLFEKRKDEVEENNYVEDIPPPLLKKRGGRRLLMERGEG